MNSIGKSQIHLFDKSKKDKRQDGLLQISQFININKKFDKKEEQDKPDSL